MPDQDSLQALQEFERHIEHLIELLNEADTDLQQAKQANDTYREKHHENAAQAGPLTDAMRAIEDKLKELNTFHNSLLAQIQEAKSQAENRTLDETNPYE